MSKTRFSQSMVLVCIAAVAACTSTGSDEGPAGNTELNVVLPDPESTDVQSVEYTICCMGNDTTFLDNAASFEDAVCINGNLEVIEAEPPEADGLDMTNAEVRQGYMDLAPGPCTVELRARDNDGEVICSDKDGFVVTADNLTTVNQTLFCGLSFQADVGQAIVIADFSYNVANFCPDLFILNCLESMPTSPTADPATTTCEVRYRDGDSQCGESCDPQTCTPVNDGPGGQASGLDCQPATDPGVSTDITCDTGTITTCTNGTINGDGSCTFTGDQVGILFDDTNGNQVVPNPATFDVSCAGALPGAPVTCTAVTTDGDTDCNKTKIVTFDCPGANFCDEPTTDCSPEANLPASEQECQTGACDRGLQDCVFENANQGDPCDNNTPGNTGSGRCNDGTCEDFGCTGNADCDLDGNDCTAPLDAGTCVSGTCSGDNSITCTTDDQCNSCQVNGNCAAEVPVAVDTPCNSNSQGAGTGRCDGAGLCEDNCDGVTCTAPDACSTSVCNPATDPGVCDVTSLPPGSSCVPANTDPPGTCLGACGTCEGTNPTVCVPKPLSCDPVNRDIVACQTPELLALDCYLLGSGAPLILDPVITPAANVAAFAGVPYTVVPTQVLNLPASLVCGFSSVLTTASILNSEANLDIFGAGETGYALNSWLDPADPFGGTARTTPHAPTTFDFIAGCGKQFGACSGSTGNPGTCNNGLVECENDLDCSGTGPGVVVPFISDSAGGSSPGPETLTPSDPGAVIFSYGYDDLQAYVQTSLGILCLGAPAVADGPPIPPLPEDTPCGFICVGGDRNGDSVPSIGRGAPVGTGTGNPNPSIDPRDTPRVISDLECDKLGVAACGGTACASTADCPLAPFGQTCDTDVNLCNPAPVSPGIPVCCEDQPGGQAFFDFSQASNVCATGQPGSDIAATEAPCNGESGTSTGGLRCEGTVTCGNCQQVTGDAPGGVFTPGVDCPEDPPGCLANGPCNLCPWPTVEFCSAAPSNGALGTCDSDENLKCPNGDSDCNGSASVPADEDFCVVPCATNVCDTGARIDEECLRDVDCQRCTGGANDNGNCTSDVDCPAACDEGFNDGLSCVTGADCPGTCSGSPFPCFVDTDCGPIGPCIEASQSCGGTTLTAAGVCDANPGTCNILGCDSDSCCDYMQERFPNALLAPVPPCDTATGLCADGLTSCNTDADCGISFPIVPVNPAP